MSTKRHARKSRRKTKTTTSIAANYQNFTSHRKLIPNLKFKHVPIVEIDVIGDGDNLIKTSNFIDKVSEYSQRPDIIQSGGFFVMRPKQRQKHRYLIDERKIDNWKPQHHSDKHYFINNTQHNSHNRKPYNKHWVYDIPQLSKSVNGEALLVGSFPQRTCDVLTPLFTAQNQHKDASSFCMTEFFQKHQALRNTHTPLLRRKRKRNQETDAYDDYATKRRKLQRMKQTPFIMPKALNIPKRDTLFDLTQHIPLHNVQKRKERFDPFMYHDTASNQSDIGSIDSNDTGSHSFPTSTSSFNDTLTLSNSYNGLYDEEDATLILSTNLEPIEMMQQAFDIRLWDKLLSKPSTKPSVTLCDMAVEGEGNSTMPHLIPSTNSPPLQHNTVSNSPPFDKDILNHRHKLQTETCAVSTDIGIDNDRKSDIVSDLDIETLRGFSFIVNQFDAENIKIDEFWRMDEFEETLLHSPYDDACAEEIPLIFASDIIRGDARYYGIIGSIDNITVYQEQSPLDLMNLSLYGPFTEFKEGGRDNEYRNGVQQPYIYLGNRSTWFAWHREDCNLYAVNHLLWGNHKLWYCIPPQSTHKVLEYVRTQYSEYCGDCTDRESCWTPLQHKQYWFDPYILLSMGIDVYFMRQKPGDIMITPPGGLHCGVNAGPNMAESVNFMTYDIDCWKICLSAMHFALFNRCQECLHSVWIDFNQLAERCRKSKKCKGKNKKYAPSIRVVPYDECCQGPICTRLTKKLREIKQSGDPISEINGEKLWIYPVRRPDAKYWFPAIWIEACYSWDTLVFEMLYRFKYLDSGTIKGRNEPELFSEKDVLWDKGLLIWDWNRTQKFKSLTQKDKKCIAKKFSYPRRQGNMLINYVNVVNKDYKSMYYQKCAYYEHFPEEIRYKDLYKKKNCKFRSREQMVKDIDKQHIYFTQPLISITTEEDDDDDDDLDYQ